VPEAPTPRHFATKDKDVFMPQTSRITQTLATAWMAVFCLGAASTAMAQTQPKKKTINCYISERIKNPNGHTSCIYKCPNGKPASESVAPGYTCPPMMNIIDR
jgi:hypothetical protein